MTRKVTGYISTDQEIEEMAKYAAFNNIEWTYSIDGEAP